MGIDTESAHTLGRRSDSDSSQLVFAASQGRTLLTYDTDFLAESALFLGTGEHHSGILLTPEWAPEELRDQVRWLLRPK